MRQLLALVILTSMLSCNKPQFDEPIKEKIRYGNVLILGNSITFHESDASLGWPNSWGMAASKQEFDYVHRLTALLKSDRPQIRLSAYNISKFENEYETYDFDAELKAYVALKPDLIILRLGENFNEATMTDAVFLERYGALISYLTQKIPAVTILSVGSFWQKKRTDGLMEAATLSAKGNFITLGELDNIIENTAWGKFTDPAVGSHPGDEGMEKIARMIYQQILKQSM